MNEFEFELSNIRLDLRMVPTDIKFPHKPKDTATEVPKNYISKFETMGTKNHTKVNLTWE